MNIKNGLVDECAHTSRFLHDGPLQVLNYIAAGGYNEVPDVEQLRNVAAAAADELRAFIDGTPAPAGTCLVSALEQVAAEARMLAPGLDIRLVVGSIDGVTDAATLSELAAATREALTNVRRHARATRVTIRCESRGTRVGIRIADDGIGFTPGPASAGRGTRHSIMGRMRDLGGRGFLESSPGGGTVVGLVLDLSCVERAPKPELLHVGATA